MVLDLRAVIPRMLIIAATSYAVFPVNHMVVAAQSLSLEPVPPQTPLGVTIQSMPRRIIMAIDWWTREPSGGEFFADESGQALYTYDGDTAPGKPTCLQECARMWPAATPRDDAEPIPDWEIATRPDHTRQWVLNGKPLYRFAGDMAPADIRGEGADGKWHLARYVREAKGVMPAGIEVAPRIDDADGPAFTDSRGMTLYYNDYDKVGVSKCSGICTEQWHPVVAAGLARPIGEWTIASRQDGTRQWAYKGAPLYTFEGDIRAGNSKGQRLSGWHAAILRTVYQPNDVQLAETLRGWTVFATQPGSTLYELDVFYYGLGHNTNSNSVPAAEDGRAIGTKGCTGDCTNTWIPFRAPDDAVARGYWSIVTREEGSKQWAYKGFPLYSYIGDKRPGDAFGYDTLIFLNHSDVRYWRLVTPSPPPHTYQDEYAGSPPKPELAGN